MQRLFVRDAGDEPLSHADSARWHMATADNPMVIGALLTMHERLTLAELEAAVCGKLLSQQRFRQHVVETPGGKAPRWRQDDPFELGAHVRQLPAVSAGDLARLAGERMSAPLPPGRSPWSLELVDLTGGGSAIVARMHHCIADGRALLAVLGDLADQPPPQLDRPARARSRLWSGLGGLARFLTLPDDPATGLRGVLSGDKRVAWSRPVAVDAVRAVAHDRRQHLTDVLLAGVTGALARHLRLQGAVPVDVRALFPVAAGPGASARRAGNRYASVFVRLPLAAADLDARLSAIAREMDRVRTGGESRIAVGLTALAGAAAAGLERRAVAWWSRKASLVVSSLRGPATRVRLAGHPVDSVVVWAPAPASIALSLSLFGYAGLLRLGILADSGVIADATPLIGAFEAEMQALGAGAAGPLN